MSIDDLETKNYCITTDNRELSISQTLLQIVEINDELAETTGIDLVSSVTAIDDAVTISSVAKKLGLSGKGYISVKNGKRYLVLKGYPGARPVLNGTRYLASNPKVSRIIVGSKSLANGAAKATGIAVIAYAGLRVVEHILAEDERSLTHLLGTIASDFMKFSAAAAAGWLAAAAVGSLTTVVAGPLIAAVAVGIGVGIVLDRVDRKYGLTETMVSALEDKVDSFYNPFNALGRWINQWEEYLVQKAINESLRYR